METGLFDFGLFVHNQGRHLKKFPEYNFFIYNEIIHRREVSICSFYNCMHNFCYNILFYNDSSMVWILYFFKKKQNNHIPNLEYMRGPYNGGIDIQNRFVRS